MSLVNKCGDCVKFCTDQCMHRETVDVSTHNCPCFTYPKTECAACRIDLDDVNAYGEEGYGMQK